MLNREYAVPYISESKGTSMAINDETAMNDFRLCGAINKMKKALIEQYGYQQHDADVLEARCREAGYRDLNPAYKGGKAPGDPRIPVKSGGDDGMDARFGAARERFRALKAGTELDDVLAEGGRKARALACRTLEECREATGLGKRLT